MRVIVFVILFLNFSVGASFGQENSCSVLGSSLYDCKSVECKTPDPENKGKFITNVVKGLNSNGECVHEQSNPDGDKLVCHYSEESRKFLGLKMKKAGSDIGGIEDATEFEENLMADIFQNECEVVSKNGSKAVVEEEDHGGADSGSFGDGGDDEGSESVGDEGGDKTQDEGEEEVDPKAVEDNGDLIEGEQN